LQAEKHIACKIFSKEHSMNKLEMLDAWKNGASNFFVPKNAQAYLQPTMAVPGGSGSSCGAEGDKPKPEPGACGSSCGAGDEKPKPKPGSCGSSCGAGDEKPKPKPSACGAS
jgi:hypothetical protein